MQSIIQWLVTAAVLFAVFLAMVLISWRKKQRKLIIPSIAVFILSVAAAGCAGFLFLTKSWRNIKTATIARSAENAYSALFGAPEPSCVQILNFTDQVIPRLDCCIWMEFAICPGELKRIILRNGFARLLPGTGTDTAMPGYSPKPGWFRPGPLTDSLLVFRHYDPANPNSDDWLFVRPDSSHVFFCSMAD